MGKAARLKKTRTANGFAEVFAKAPKNFDAAKTDASKTLLGTQILESLKTSKKSRNLSEMDFLKILEDLENYLTSEQAEKDSEEFTTDEEYNEEEYLGKLLNKYFSSKGLL